MRQGRRRLSGLVLLLAVVMAAPAAGITVFYFLAAWTASIPLLAIAGLCAMAGLAWCGAWLDGRIWPVKSLTRFAGWTSGLLTLASAIALFFAVFRPTPVPHYEPLAALASYRPGTRYWNLPTGSRIGYWEYQPPPGVAVRAEPIICLHGGPGGFTAPWEITLCKAFAADGFRVYLFDQAGSGTSSDLPVGDYSVARSVADLEAIRKEVGASKVILIGHSWGSTLAANYIAAHPENVTKVVFHSPGRIWNWEMMNFDYSPTAGRGPALPLPLRFIVAVKLFGRNPKAAENLVSQREIGAMFAKFSDLGDFVCKGDTDKIPHGPIPPELNSYPLFAAYRDTELQSGEPYSRLRHNKTQAILAYAECDYLSWKEIVFDYRNEFDNLKVYYFPRAGHFIQLSQPELLTNVVRAFLLDAPDVIPPVIGDADPRPAKSASRPK